MHPPVKWSNCRDFVDDHRNIFGDYYDGNYDDDHHHHRLRRVISPWRGDRVEKSQLSHILAQPDDDGDVDDGDGDDGDDDDGNNDDCDGDGNDDDGE